MSKKYSLIIISSIVFLIFLNLMNCSQNPSDSRKNSNMSVLPETEDDSQSLLNDIIGYFYIREEASGGNDGTSWENAYTTMPTTFERGYAYLVAKGNYSLATLNDHVDDASYIYIIKATPDFHGTANDWNNSYGEGQTSFGTLDIEGNYYYIDGGSTQGFSFIGDYEGKVITIHSDYIVFKNCLVDGNFQKNGEDYHIDGACTGMGIKGSHVIIKDCDIFNVADDCLEISDSTELYFAQNTIHMMHACGTDGGSGPCYNGHSDGLELYKVRDSVFDGNMIYDVNSTSALYLGNWADELGNGPSDYCSNLVFVNNIFYTPETGFAAYFQDVDNLKVYNNVIWGVRQGAYGGLCIGENITNLEMYNNIILSINYNHLGITYDVEQHRGNYNFFAVDLEQYTMQSHDIEGGDPNFVSEITDFREKQNPVKEDFMLESNSACRNSGTPHDNFIYDIVGNSRPYGNSWDIGVFEYVE